MSMIDLEAIQTKNKAKRILKGITFPPGSHVAYTNWGQGGAASGLNDPILLKSKIIKPLTEHDKKILLDMGYTESELEESKSDTSVQENKQTNVSKGKEMSDPTVEELQAELKQIRLERKLEKSLSKYELQDGEAVASAMAMLDESVHEAIYKAFDELTNRVELEKSAKKEAIQKASKLEVKDNEIAKALSQEAGDAGEAIEVEKAHKDKKSLKAKLEAKYKSMGVK